MKAGLDRDRVALAAVTVTNVRLGEENDDLRRVVAAQAEEIARLQALVERLTEQVGAVLAAQTGGDDGAGATARPTTMPGLKPKPKRAPERPTRPRQRRARAYGRRRSLPTQRQGHAMACCPHCQTILHGGTIRRTREVIEIAPSPLVVTEHVYVERRCPRCRGRWLPEPGLGAVVVGQGRLGVGVLSRIAVLREEFRLPVAAIQRLLELAHGLCLSVGAIVGAAHTVAQQADAAVARIWAAVRASPVVHVDETGWREDGQNGYVWTFSTETERAFVRGGRERAVLERELGDAYAGTLVSDFYAAYTSYPGMHQYCWAHLLRDIDELAEQHRRDPTVTGWAAAVHDLYGRARAFADPGVSARRRAQDGFAAELQALGQPYHDDAEAPQRVLCQRIVRHRDALFVFVADPAVPATNNAAERSLRHLVTSRKISGGTRSAQGSATKMTLATLFGTWRAQDLDPFAACHALLTNPQL